MLFARLCAMSSTVQRSTLVGNAAPAFRLFTVETRGARATMDATALLAQNEALLAENAKCAVESRAVG